MRMMRDVIGSQKLIPYTLIILVYFHFNTVPDIAYTCYSKLFTRLLTYVFLQILQRE